ncbi:DUF4124 domain-containing protein [Pseudogulbenkiania sp. MAI-1]|uniref:DUF4124 domain-containing protein n=1 Tax=Pseudogulbenkiania sp. MAI-1 TaxID=990370 RepID=UPI00045E9965|nr:DUF4124 domain-containing protein [Pseudogulbenkiania sp. MAI-1]
MPRLAGLLLALLPLTVLAGGTLYKWVDESGKVHYSDAPPLQAPNNLVELDRRGSVTRSVETPKERAAREAREAAAQSDAARQRYQARYDKGLLESYQSPDELRAEREKQLAVQQSILDALQNDRKTLQQNIVQQTRQIEALQKSGKPVPPALSTNLGILRQQAAHTEAAIISRQAEIANQTRKMRYDLERYHQLTRR